MTYVIITEDTCKSCCIYLATSRLSISGPPGPSAINPMMGSMQHPFHLLCFTTALAHLLNAAGRLSSAALT